MTIHKHECAHYKKIMAELTVRRRSYSRMYSNLSGLLIRWGTTHFTQNEMQVLFFILGRTLLFGKCAEKILRQHFIDGVTNEDGLLIAAGLSIRVATLKAVLKSFADKGYVNVHSFERNGIENVPRVYEINYTVISRLFNDFYCTKLQESVEELRKLDDACRRRIEKALQAIEKPNKKIIKLDTVKRRKRPEIGGTPRMIGGVSQVYPLSRELKDITLLRKVSSLPQRLPVDEENGMGKKIADDCKNAQDIVSAIKEKHSTNRGARAAAARTITKKKWSMRELQALLDTASKEANSLGYPVPRIVATTKGTALFHKRLLDYGVSDGFDFIRWALVNWSAVASANFRAKQKNPQKSSDAMLQTPNFNDLVFRCPYIIAFYNDAKNIDNLHEKQKADETQKQQIAKQSADEASAARRERAKQLDLQRERERKDREQLLRTTMRKGSDRIPISDDSELPSVAEWERRRGLRK